MKAVRTLFGMIVVVLSAVSMTAFAQDSLNVRRLSQIVSSYYHYAFDVATVGNRAYICSWSQGLSIADISNPDTLIDVGSFYPPC